MRVLTKADLKCRTSGKRMFVDAVEAEDAMRLAWEEKDRHRNTHGRMPRKVYECPDCGWWHLSSRPDSRT